MGNGRILGFPFPIWILFVTAVLFQIFLSQSIAGRNIYAIGGNPVVARFSGINVNRYRVAIYVMSGFAATSHVKYASRFAASNFTWWAPGDSNPRPSRCKRDALTN